MPRRVILVVATALILCLPSRVVAQADQYSLPYPIVDTGVTEFYSSTSVIPRPKPGERFFGQDAQYQINPPAYHDNGDGTVTDLVTGLMWRKSMGAKMTFAEAAGKARESIVGGHNDWRVPNAKELRTIVDYARSPQTTHSAAIDPVFDTTAIKDPSGNAQYPCFWTGTTHRDGPNLYDSAVYVAFGAAEGMMFGRLMDVHGAGAQRNDPKTGSQADYPHYFGPQGDLRTVFNFVRCARTMD